jgi:hypothetical protein
VTEEVPDSLYGIIQHSFGLQLFEQFRPFSSWDNSPRVAERFDSGRFRAVPVGGLVGNLATEPYATHSPLAQRGLTTHKALKLRFFGPLPSERLPDGFGWADSTPGPSSRRFEVPRFVFADEYDRTDNPSFNDFLLSDREDPAQREPMSQLLLELMAHKRSRLFGFRLANRVVNVHLPHAVLSPHDLGMNETDAEHAWFLQPVLSFIRGGMDRRRLRPTYSLTFLLVPIAVRGKFARRATSAAEIERVVNASWGFAAAQTTNAVAKYQVSGDLFEYLRGLAGQELRIESEERRPLGLRRIIELVAFGVGLRLAQGRTARARPRTARLIGNEVIMALGSTRVSSVVMVDPSLAARDVRRPVGKRAFPEPLSALMTALAGSARPPQSTDKSAREYRLDRPLVDPDLYAMGVLPARRCLVVVSRPGGQYGIRESALMQAGSIAYMTIGAATAIASMRAIDLRLERLDGADPTKIAEIDREIASDLAEIHDLDITREAYREIYRHLRERLGIARDFEILQNKMDTLYRATSTIHGRRADRSLAWLTAAIVVLSLFILIGTVALVGHGG